MPRALLLPILVTLAAELAWATLLVVSRVLLVRLEIDPWAFTFVQLTAGGVFLLLMAGPGSIGIGSFRRPATWALGIFRVLTAAAFTACLVWISVLEATVMGAINVPMVALAVWVVFSRRPARGEWVGHLVILAAIAPIVARLEGGLLHPVVLLMLFNEVCVVGATVLAEWHPDNRTDDPRARLRFTGAVLLATALLFLAVRLVQGSLSESGVGGDGVWSPTLLIAGLAVGVLLRGPSMFLAFWSVKLVGAQNYLAAAALLPLFGMALEEAAHALGLIDVTRFEPSAGLLALVVGAGTMLVVAARRRAARRAEPAAPS